MKKLIMVMLLVFGSFQLAGCETLKGVSKDLSKIGKNVEDNLIKSDGE